MSKKIDMDNQIETEMPSTGNFARGIAVIRASLKTMPTAPGVYRMLDAKGEALYVGKAANLKNRVNNYTHINALPVRLKRMIAETYGLEIAITHTEVEALLLECNLIKRLLPHYNVLLRDDKSFPYIQLTGNHPFPQLTKHRGARGRDGDYFGPFASAGAVNRTLIALQRAFLLRSCSDSVFAMRTRPCLLYQIKRCSAPCTGRINQTHYARLVTEARRFLSGKSHEVQAQLARHMQELSDQREYESAALIRDRIRALTQVQGRQDINLDGLGDADIVALYQVSGYSSIQVFFFRGGQNWGNRAYFPAQARNLGPAEVIGAFLGQFYDNKPPPPQVVVSHRPAEATLLAEALAARAGHKVTIIAPERGDKRKLVEQALLNAREALGRRLGESTAQRRLLEGVAKTFGLDAPPQRIEVYDNSHIQGAHAVGAMIVAGPEGLIKNSYRKFNIRGPIAPGDDYAMMREVFCRRFARTLKEGPDRGLPDLVLIDGGQGQLSVASQVLADLGINDLPVIGIAKGPDRNAGRERFFRLGKPPLTLDTKDPVLYFLQRLRDEAHRCAIGAHRSKRARAIGASPLNEIAGIGAARKRALLHHFGSARAVAVAGVSDLERVTGISKVVAKKIYDHFHAEG